MNPVPSTGAEDSLEASSLIFSEKKKKNKKKKNSEKNKISLNGVCCSRDWRFKG